MAPAADPGVVDEQIEPTERLDRAIHEPSAFLGLRNVGRHDDDFAVGRPKFAGQLVQGLGITRCERNANSSPHERAGERPANTAARAGQDRSLGGEVAFHEFLVVTGDIQQSAPTMIPAAR